MNCKGWKLVKKMEKKMECVVCQEKKRKVWGLPFKVQGRRLVGEPMICRGCLLKINREGV